jgi:XTP/dITP diphosphohydrolase
MEQKLKAFERLLNIMDELREKCPWDQKQTMESLRHLTIEETYELGDAILDGDLNEVKQELGDLIMHIVFYAKIGSEKKSFDIADVLNGVCDKLVERHPHIYGDTTVENADDVKHNWEQIKLKEGGRKSVLGGVPQSLPALVKAFRMQEKAAGVGFDWSTADDVWAKVEEELQELKHEHETKAAQGRLEDEFGDVLFSLVNFSRYLNVNPEDALERTNKKFLKRFQHIEKRAKEKGQNLADLTLAEMDVYWNEAKTL